MALAEAGKAIVWMRQLLAEIEHEFLIQPSTVLFGDNNAANQLTVEHFVSTGNQYIPPPPTPNRNSALYMVGCYI